MLIKKFFREGVEITHDFVVGEGDEAIQIPFQNLFVWSDEELAAYGVTKTEEAPPILIVSAAQARLALLDAGLLDAVEAAVNAHPLRAVKVWYEYATYWERGNPYVQALAVELGLDDAAVDALFAVADKK